MKVARYTDGRSLLDAARAWLLRAEAENNLILGSAPTIAHAPPATAGEAVYLATIHSDAEVVGCAMRTPPHKLVITRLPAEGIPALVDDVVAFYGVLPGVLGPEPTVATFAGVWSKRTDQRATEGRRQRIYEIERVLPPPHPPTGRLRSAREPDLELVAAWIAAFTAEPLDETLNATEVAANRIRRGMVLLWEDPEPVSMAAWAGKTPNGIRVNLVYTPPQHRGRGYASACVSSLTSRLLKEGNRFCFLFTDLSNPTANRIYQRLGYRPVCDATDYQFAG
jgi:ribosomal protein S18 acetylase RimI-like enzyme